MNSMIWQTHFQGICCFFLILRINFSVCWIWLNWDEIVIAWLYYFFTNFWTIFFSSTGFRPEIVKMCEHSSMPSKENRQTLMFSATFPSEVQQLALGEWDGILLSKPDLLWEKILKFEAEGREFAKFLRSVEEFIQTVKGRNNFW